MNMLHTFTGASGSSNGANAANSNETTSGSVGSGSGADASDLKQRLIANVKKEVKQLMEEAVTKKYIHEDSSSVTSLCGAVEACLSHGLRRRALGLFKTSSTTALIQKIAKTCPEADYITRRLLEIELANESHKIVAGKRSSSSSDSIIKPKLLSKAKDSRCSISSSSVTTINTVTAGTNPTSLKYLWIRLALYERRLAKIIEYLVSNACNYYDREALVANSDYGSILSSLLVGPCALEFTQAKAADHYWTDPRADELVQRHRISSGNRTPPTCHRPIINFKRSLHTSSEDTSSGSYKASSPASVAKDYVESLHQNSRTTLLYGKNNVLVLPKDVSEPMPGYLSLHQSVQSLIIKWTPNQLMNGGSGSGGGGTMGSGSIISSYNDNDMVDRKQFWDYALNINVDEIIYVHCHQNRGDDTGGTIVLVGQDGVQRPPIHFPEGGHLESFLSCLETGLLPHGQLDPPLWSQRGIAKLFPWPKSMRRRLLPSVIESTDETPIDYVFRVVSKSKHEEFLATHPILEPGGSSPRRKHLGSCSTTGSSDCSSKSLSIDQTATDPPLKQTSQTASIELVCSTMRRQIISRAFYGWLAYCRHLSTVRTHLSGLVNGRITPDLTADEQGLTREKWDNMHINGIISDDMEVYRLVYFGGIEPQLRKEVWPYLLGHYSFGSTPSEREKYNETCKHYYETTMSEWLAVEAIVRQREKEKNALAVAKLSAEKARKKIISGVGNVDGMMLGNDNEQISNKQNGFINADENDEQNKEDAENDNDDDDDDDDVFEDNDFSDISDPGEDYNNELCAEEEAAANQTCKTQTEVEEIDECTNLDKWQKIDVNEKFIAEMNTQAAVKAEKAQKLDEDKDKHQITTNYTNDNEQENAGNDSDYGQEKQQELESRANETAIYANDDELLENTEIDDEPKVVPKYEEMKQNSEAENNKVQLDVIGQVLLKNQMANNEHENIEEEERSHEMVHDDNDDDDKDVEPIADRDVTAEADNDNADPTEQVVLEFENIDDMEPLRMQENCFADSEIDKEMALTLDPTGNVLVLSIKSSPSTSSYETVGNEFNDINDFFQQNGLQQYDNEIEELKANEEENEHDKEEIVRSVNDVKDVQENAVETSQMNEQCNANNNNNANDSDNGNDCAGDDDDDDNDDDDDDKAENYQEKSKYHSVDDVHNNISDNENAKFHDDDDDDDNDNEQELSTLGHAHAVIITEAASLDALQCDEEPTVDETSRKTSLMSPMNEDITVVASLDALQEPKSACVSPASSNGGVYSVELLENFGLNLQRIEKDVQRCDRNYWYFANENLDKLRNVISTYVWEHLDIGYMQGMCDLVAPLLVIFDDEALCYSCFCKLMERMIENFPHGHAMDMHFANMRSLIQILDSEMYDLMNSNGDYTHFYFCYRWFLLDFKRELVYDDVFSIWETIWAAKHVASGHFVLFLALALLETYRDIILSNSMNFTDVIKFFNEMAERHDARSILQLSRNLVLQLQTLIENK